VEFTPKRPKPYPVIEQFWGRAVRASHDSQGSRGASYLWAVCNLSPSSHAAVWCVERNCIAPEGLVWELHRLLRQSIDTLYIFAG
jgi:hypothetical protein